MCCRLFPGSFPCAAHCVSSVFNHVLTPPPPSPLSLSFPSSFSPPSPFFSPSPSPPRAFTLSFSVTDLKDLNIFLQSHSYLVGFSASAADAALFTALAKEPCASKFPNVARFYKHIASLSGDARKALPALIGGVSVGGAAPAPAAKAAKANADADEDVDLFGDDADAKPAAAVAPKVEEKKKKEKPVARSICVYEVKPMSASTDPKSMEAALRTIVMDGLKWSETFEVIEIGYGVKKIMVQFVCEDDKVDLTDLEERMLAFKGTEVDEESGEIEDLIQSVDQ